MGKSTISMAIFNSYVSLPEGKSQTVTNVIGVMLARGGNQPTKATKGPWVTATCCTAAHFGGGFGFPQEVPRQGQADD